MEYGSIVWDPHQQTRIKTLEAVQNKGARYVNQDWDRYKSVTTMKKDLGWLTLQERRLVNRLTFLMKSIHNIHGHTLPPSACLTRHTESYTNLRARTHAYKFSFIPRSIRAWNSLPPEIIVIKNSDTYRNAIVTALRKGTIEIMADSKWRTCCKPSFLRLRQSVCFKVRKSLRETSRVPVRVSKDIV